jgi:hypothetical protein
MAIQSDDDRELELRVSDVAYEVANFAWADLAERLPVGRTYVRPESEGPYMAVTWDADWKGRENGPILIRINGYLDCDHANPVWGTGEIIERQPGWLTRLLDRFGS